MKKSILVSCTMAVLGFAAIQTVASAQEPSGLEGFWFAVVTPVTCDTHVPIPNALPFNGLNLFSHDGSLTNEAAFPMAVPLRSSGLGGWQHTQGHMYTATFRFFRYQEGGPGLVSFLVMRKVSLTILLNGDQFTSFDMFQDYDAANKPLMVRKLGCNIETNTRL